MHARKIKHSPKMSPMSFLEQNLIQNLQHKSCFYSNVENLMHVVAEKWKISCLQIHRFLFCLTLSCIETSCEVVFKKQSPAISVQFVFVPVSHTL